MLPTVVVISTAVTKPPDASNVPLQPPPSTNVPVVVKDAQKAGTTIKSDNVIVDKMRRIGARLEIRMRRPP